MKSLHHASEPVRWLFAFAVSLAAIHDGVSAFSQVLMDARRGSLTPSDWVCLLLASVEMIACFGVFSRSSNYRLVSSSLLLFVFVTDKLSANGDIVPFWGIVFCSLLAIDAWCLKSQPSTANAGEVSGTLPSMTLH
jgi:hypothetical protein